MPPIGAPVADHAAAYPSLMFTVPARTRAARRRPAATSRVQMLALSPYAVSLARVSASSSEPTR